VGNAGYLGEGNSATECRLFNSNISSKDISLAYSEKAIGFRGGYLGRFGEHVHTFRERRWVCVKIFYSGGS